MAQDCSLDQTLKNLVHHAARVFEAILQAECRKIMPEVKAIREQKVFPICRSRYQLIGENYRLMVINTFQGSLPNVHVHL